MSGGKKDRKNEGAAQWNVSRKKRKILTKPVESLRFRFVRAGADVDAVDAAAVDEHPFCL